MKGLNLIELTNRATEFDYLLLQLFLFSKFNLSLVSQKYSSKTT